VNHREVEERFTVTGDCGSQGDQEITEESIHSQGGQEITEKINWFTRRSGDHEVRIERFTNLEAGSDRSRRG
jgi:hypothetical protein